LGAHGGGEGRGHIVSPRAQLVMDALQNTSEKNNIKINTKKTKVTRMSQAEGRPVKIKVNGQNLEREKKILTSEVW